MRRSKLSSPYSDSGIICPALILRRAVRRHRVRPSLEPVGRSWSAAEQVEEALVAEQVEEALVAEQEALVAEQEAERGQVVLVVVVVHHRQRARLAWRQVIRQMTFRSSMAISLCNQRSKAR